MAGEAPILIAGAGIAGLAAAIGLAHAGRRVRIFEKRADFEEAGAGIQIGPNGVKALRALKVADAVGANAVAPRAVRMLCGRSGACLAEIPLGAVIAARHGAPYWTVAREDLHAALRGAAEALADRITIERPQVATAVVESGRGVALSCAHAGAAIEGAALIDASGVRTLLASPGEPRPRPSGKVAVRAVLPIAGAPKLARDHVVGLWLGEGTHLVHYPVAAGRMLNVVAVHTAADLDLEAGAVLAAGSVARAFRRWAPEATDLIARAPAWRCWTLCDGAVAPDRRPHVLAIGDAAGPVLPFLAQGGVLALEDAVELAAAVRRSGDIAAAIALVRDGRLRRRARVAAASRRNGRIYQLAGLAAAARNAVLKITPPARLLAQFDWLYGAEPPPQ